MCPATRPCSRASRAIFKPRFPPPYLVQQGATSTGFYDTTPLTQPCGSSWIDLLNSGSVRASFGVVNVRTGNFAYFDSLKDTLRPEHIAGLGRLAAGLPVEIDGEHYWDGGVVSSTPLAELLTTDSMRDTLAFQVDLWPARGDQPGGSGRTPEGHPVLQPHPPGHGPVEARAQAAPWLAASAGEAAGRRAQRGGFADIHKLSLTPATNIINLIYESKHRDVTPRTTSSAPNPCASTESGLADIPRHARQAPGILARPTEDSCFVTHDIRIATARAPELPEQGAWHLDGFRADFSADWSDRCLAATTPAGSSGSLSGQIALVPGTGRHHVRRGPSWWRSVVNAPALALHRSRPPARPILLRHGWLVVAGLPGLDTAYAPWRPHRPDGPGDTCLLCLAGNPGEVAARCVHGPA